MEVIRTARLELVPLSGSFADALKRGDRGAAEREVGARISRWLVDEPAHFVQLQLAQFAADAIGMAGIGRTIVLVPATGRRRVIGSIGFHGPPDERGRLEVGCAIEPASRRRGYAAEALKALVAWAAEEVGVTRFVLSIQFEGEPVGTHPVEFGYGPADWPDDALRTLVRAPQRTDH